MESELAIATIKESCYQVGYPINDKEHERRKLINESCDYAIECIGKLEKIEQIINSRNGFYLYDNLPPFQQIKEILEQE